MTEIDPALTAEVLKTIKQVGKRGRCVDLHELAVIVKCCEDKQAYPV